MSLVFFVCLFVCFLSLHACPAREVTQQARIRDKEAKPPPPIPTPMGGTLGEQLRLVVMFA